MIILDRQRPQIEIPVGILVWLEMAKAAVVEEEAAEEEAVEVLDEWEVVKKTEIAASMGKTSTN